MNDEHPYSPYEEPKHSAAQPWWNDKDKAGGLVATIIMLTLVIVVAIIAIACAFKIAAWIL